jgi:hypothetical protein
MKNAMADAIGLIVLAGLTALCAAIVPTSEVPTPLFFFVYLALAMIGLYAWHGEKFPQGTWGWLLTVFSVIVIGAINFGINAMIGYSHHPEFTLLNAVTSSGDGVLTIMLYPSIIFVGLAGAARSIYIHRKHRQ